MIDDGLLERYQVANEIRAEAFTAAVRRVRREMAAARTTTRRERRKLAIARRHVERRGAPAVFE